VFSGGCRGAAQISAERGFEHPQQHSAQSVVIGINSVFQIEKRVQERTLRNAA
jgi:hypothetical protein